MTLTSSVIAASRLVCCMLGRRIRQLLRSSWCQFVPCLRQPLPAGMALDAAKVAFESFGEAGWSGRLRSTCLQLRRSEVARVQRLEKFDNFVQAG